jgi:hypothetical protein
MWFELVIGFIGFLQIVTTYKNYDPGVLHTSQLTTPYNWVLLACYLHQCSGNGFQRPTFPLVWDRELSPCFSHSNSWQPHLPIVLPFGMECTENHLNLFVRRPWIGSLRKHRFEHLYCCGRESSRDYLEPAIFNQSITYHNPLYSLFLGRCPATDIFVTLFRYISFLKGHFREVQSLAVTICTTYFDIKLICILSESIYVFRTILGKVQKLNFVTGQGSDRRWDIQLESREVMRLMPGLSKISKGNECWVWSNGWMMITRGKRKNDRQ